MVSQNIVKPIFLLLVFSSFILSCKNDCYRCVLEQVNGPAVLPFPDSTIHIDTLETCSYKWVKENNVPEGEVYPQSWRCKKN